MTRSAAAAAAALLGLCRIAESSDMTNATETPTLFPTGAPTEAPVPSGPVSRKPPVNWNDFRCLDEDWAENTLPEAYWDKNWAGPAIFDDRLGENSRYSVAGGSERFNVFVMEGLHDADLDGDGFGDNKPWQDWIEFYGYGVSPHTPGRATEGDNATGFDATENVGWVNQGNAENAIVFEVNDWDSFVFQLKQIVMPVSVLALYNAAQISRFMRASMLDNLNQDYVRTARAKGLKEKTVVMVHVLRNSMIPVVTVIALGVPTVFGGAIITEQVFKVNGLGQMLIISIQGNDLPMVQTLTFIFAILIVLFNLLADVLYGILDPRIRYD